MDLSEETMKCEDCGNYVWIKGGHKEYHHHASKNSR